MNQQQGLRIRYCDGPTQSLSNVGLQGLTLVITAEAFGKALGLVGMAHFFLRLVQQIKGRQRGGRYLAEGRAPAWA